MTVKIGINGLGRIGRMVVRSILENKNKNIEIKHINNRTDSKNSCHLLKYDSIHGRFNADIKFNEKNLFINRKKISFTRETEINKINWKKNDVDIVLECTGKNNSKDKSFQHIKSGAKKVIVSAPCKNADKTIVYGVNHKLLNRNDRIFTGQSTLPVNPNPRNWKSALITGWYGTETIGDKAILDVDPFKLIDSDANANTTLLGFIGAILKDNNFYFLPLPSYINFYGVTSVDGEQISKFNSSEEANSLFGTHLEVDYLDSKPKFLCMYVGEPSQHMDVQSDIYRYDTDSFLLGRTSDNPLFSNCADPQKCNKVVAFNVDFGVENQGVFKGISLDQNEFRNTAESFRLTQSLADSSNDKTISTQGLNLFN